MFPLRNSHLLFACTGRRSDGCRAYGGRSVGGVLAGAGTHPLDGFIYLTAGAALGALALGGLAFITKDSIRFYALLGAGAGAIVTIPSLMILNIFVIKGLLAIVLFTCVSPMLGLIVSYVFASVLTKIMANSKHPTKMNKWFQRAQIFGSGFQAMSLGGNDAQNAMGVIIAILISAGLATSDAELPLWVILLSALAISLGLLSGGWKVIKKMGSGITQIRPYQGFSASISGGMVLSFMTTFGVPVSTTHVATGTIMGTRVTRGTGAVKWGAVRQMVTAWILTIPATAAVSGVCYLVAQVVFGF